MIYSVGYSRSKPELIQRLAIELDATILDVRGTPRSRSPQWNRSSLERLLGSRYEWVGQELGNHGANRVTEAGLDRLAARPGDFILMCAERPPGECHRHHQIALPLLGRGIDVLHIYEDQIVQASDLQRAIEGKAESYPLWGVLAFSM